MPNTPVQKEIQSLFSSLVAEGKETGLQATAYYEGKLVLDVWAGTQSHGGKAVDGETLFPVFSTGKGMVATVIHLLAERKLLAYEDPIAQHWPAFAANGKAEITIRQAMNHTAGLAYLPNDMPAAQMLDWDAMCRWLEQVAPSPAPGSETIYHAVTYGWILGELARRIDGRPFVQILNEDICRPLGITTMYFGIPESVEDRVAIIGEPPPAPDKTPTGKAVSIPATIWPLGPWINRHDTQHACIPASNGIMNTRAIARHYAALVPGGIDGIEILPPSRIALATDRPSVIDNTGMTPKSLGYAIGGGESLFGQHTTSFGHVGHGGSLGYADPKSRFAFAFARNQFQDGATSMLIARETRRILGIE